MNNTDRTASTPSTRNPNAAQTNKSLSARANEKEPAEVIQEQVVVPVIEEELNVGKREVNRGGVRVSSRLVETPVEENVSLREESVQVERNFVDRPVEARDLDNFQGGTVEFIETDQEAVVAKKARVVEEVKVSKEVTQRTDRIREVLRHTEVDVQSVAAAGRTGTATELDTDFRQDYATAGYAQQGYAYETVAPAYQFGYKLGTSEDFKGKDWESLERDAACAWEERRPGTWEQVKAAARHAWDKVTGRA
jgi:stress response protein YsnF